MARGTLADVCMSTRWLAAVEKHWRPCLDADSTLVGPEWSLILPAFLMGFQELDSMALKVLSKSEK